jgi:hypothetical protein
LVELPQVLGGDREVGVENHEQVAPGVLEAQPYRVALARAPLHEHLDVEFRMFGGQLEPLRGGLAELEVGMTLGGRLDHGSREIHPPPSDGSSEARRSPVPQPISSTRAA